MATADRTLMLKLIADVNQPAKQLKGLSGALKKSASAAKAWGKAFAGALVIGGIEKVVDSLDDALAGFKDGEDAARTLGQTWKNLGRDADQLGRTIDFLGDTAIDLGFDDAEVIRGFNTLLVKTGSVDKSMRGVRAAMDLARARGIPLSKALKLIGSDLDHLDQNLKRNRHQALIWARRHPLEVGLGSISDAWETFVGQFSRGNVNKAFAALGNIGETIRTLLFGGVLDKKKGIKTEGLIAQFTKIGQKLVPAIITGLSDLGAQLLLAWNTATAGVDWGKAIGDAVGGAVELLLDNTNIIANLAIVAGFLAAGLFVADVFAAAAAAMFAAPAFLFNAALRGAVFAAGKSLMLALRFAMFLADTAVTAMAGGLQLLIGKIPIGTGSVVGKAAGGLGRALQGLIVAGLVVGFAAELADEIAKVEEQLGLDPHSGGTHLVFNPETGRWELQRLAAGGVSDGGMALVGEEGPELVRLPRGARVFPADETAAMLGGGHPWGGVTINITTGVGDPVEIGRQVDRVLRAYRGRAGVAA